MLSLVSIMPLDWAIERVHAPTADDPTTKTQSEGFATKDGDIAERIMFVPDPKVQENPGKIEPSATVQ